MISEPTVRAGGLVLVVPRMEVLGPYARAVVPPDLCRARAVLEASEPRVMEPVFKVWPEIMYWDWAFGVMVWSLMVIGAGTFALAGTVGKVSAEVVRVLEPAALVVSRIIAGRWVEVETVSPWALVDFIIVGRDVEIEAVDAGEVVTTGSSPFAVCSTNAGKRLWSGIKSNEVGFPARDGDVAGGTFDVPTLVGISLSVLWAGASVEEDPSSDSVDVDVAVRYNAVCSADAASTPVSVGLQFQTPRSGKSPSTTPAVPIQSAPHASPPKLVKVQPLGSSIILTPVV